MTSPAVHRSWVLWWGCSYNQPLHSLSLAHGVMNPQVLVLHHRLLCPASVPVLTLPAPQAHPSHPSPLSAVPSPMFAPAPVGMVWEHRRLAWPEWWQHQP